MDRLTANPPTLDAAARDELARKAEAVKSCGCTREFDVSECVHDMAFIDACSPDVILSLLAAVERGEETDWQLTRAKSALENYGRHHPWCEKTLVAGSYPPPCNCGYEQAIRDADPVNVANAVSGANARAARSATPTEGDDR